VRDGLLRDQKRLPAWLFYDTEGSRLYELITELPEYYPCRTERAILARYARDVAVRATTGSDEEVSVVDLGAGTATKTQLVYKSRSGLGCRRRSPKRAGKFGTVLERLEGRLRENGLSFEMYGRECVLVTIVNTTAYALIRTIQAFTIPTTRPVVRHCHGR
jgi:hypothetical protein